ncbi:MAG: type VII secretion integral membrane protein EccD [Ornithinimicrobium sp.]
MTVVAGPFLRATVVSDEKTVDVVLPTDQAVSLLMPTLLQLVGRADAGERSEVGYDLVTLEGEAVDQDQSFATSGLRDGVYLRIVALRESPPAPVVYDLVDVAEAVRPWGLWSARTRRWVIASLAAVLVALTTALWVVRIPPDTTPVVAGMGGLALLASVVSAWRRDAALAWSSWALGGAALAVALVRSDLSGGPLFIWSLLLAALIILCGGWAGRRLRATVSALLMLVLLGVTTWVSIELTDDLALTAAVVATVCGIGVGVLPRIALASTGAFSIDAKVTKGTVLSRSPVEQAIGAAHTSLAGAVVVASVGFGLGSYLTLTRSDFTIWPVALVVTLVVGWSVRVRHFPLAVQRTAMLLASISSLVGLGRAVMEAHPDVWPLVVASLYAVAAAAVFVLLMRGTDLLGALARRWANRVETVSVVATLPLLVGVFGVYGDLLDTF